MGVSGANIVYVSNKSELLEAVKARTADTTIVLKSGDYGTVLLDSKTISKAPLKLVSEVPSGAKFEGLTVKGVSGLSVDGVQFNPLKLAGQNSSDSGLAVFSSSNVVIKNCDFNGQFNGDGRGLTVRGSNNVVVTDNSFDGLYRGAVFGKSTDLVVTGNVVTRATSDGFNFSEVQRVEVGHNKMSDFAPNKGSHPDFIQFWTTGSTKSSTDVHIHDNVFTSNPGQGAQGIFFGNEWKVPYKNIVIENNVIHTDMIRGISLLLGSNVAIKNNIVDSPGPGINKALVLIGDVTGAVVTDNKADGFAVGGATTGLVVTGNQFVQTGTAGNDRLVGSNFDDIIRGGAGNDDLRGNAGNDVLVGGHGNDILNGGAGADTFVFSADDIDGGGRDTVRDLNFAAGDRLVLENFGAATFKGVAGGNPLQLLSDGQGVVLDSINDIVELNKQSDAVTIRRFATDNLLLSIKDADGDVMQIQINNHYKAFMDAGSHIA